MIAELLPTILPGRWAPLRAHHSRERCRMHWPQGPRTVPSRRGWHSVRRLTGQSGKHQDSTGPAKTAQRYKAEHERISAAGRPPLTKTCILSNSPAGELNKTRGFLYNSQNQKPTLLKKCAVLMGPCRSAPAVSVRAATRARPAPPGGNLGENGNKKGRPLTRPSADSPRTIRGRSADDQRTVSGRSADGQQWHPKFRESRPKQAPWRP